jgi:hypothetical protein
MVELEWLTKGQDEDIPQPRGRPGSNGINAAAAELRRWTATLHALFLASAEDASGVRARVSE